MTARSGGGGSLSPRTKLGVPGTIYEIDGKRYERIGYRGSAHIFRGLDADDELFKFSDRHRQPNPFGGAKVEFSSIPKDEKKRVLGPKKCSARMGNLQKDDVKAMNDLQSRINPPEQGTTAPHRRTVNSTALNESSPTQDATMDQTKEYRDALQNMGGSIVGPEEGDKAGEREWYHTDGDGIDEISSVAGSNNNSLGKISKLGVTARMAEMSTSTEGGLGLKDEVKAEARAEGRAAGIAESEALTQESLKIYQEDHIATVQTLEEKHRVREANQVGKLQRSEGLARQLEENNAQLQAERARVAREAEVLAADVVAAAELESSQKDLQTASLNQELEELRRLRDAVVETADPGEEVTAEGEEVSCESEVEPKKGEAHTKRPAEEDYASGRFSSSDSDEGYILRERKSGSRRSDRATTRGQHLDALRRREVELLQREREAESQASKEDERLRSLSKTLEKREAKLKEEESSRKAEADLLVGKEEELELRARKITERKEVDSQRIRNLSKKLEIKEQELEEQARTIEGSKAAVDKQLEIEQLATFRALEEKRRTEADLRESQKERSRSERLLRDSEASSVKLYEKREAILQRAMDERDAALKRATDSEAALASAETFTADKGGTAKKDLLQDCLDGKKQLLDQISRLMDQRMGKLEKHTASLAAKLEQQAPTSGPVGSGGYDYAGPTGSGGYDYAGPTGSDRHAYGGQPDGGGHDRHDPDQTADFGGFQRHTRNESSRGRRRAGRGMAPHPPGFDEEGPGVARYGRAIPEELDQVSADRLQESINALNKEIQNIQSGALPAQAKAVQESAARRVVHQLQAVRDFNFVTNGRDTGRLIRGVTSRRQYDAGVVPTRGATGSTRVAQVSRHTGNYHNREEVTALRYYGRRDGLTQDVVEEAKDKCVPDNISDRWPSHCALVSRFAVKARTHVVSTFVEDKGIASLTVGAPKCTFTAKNTPNDVGRYLVALDKRVAYYACHGFRSVLLDHLDGLSEEAETARREVQSMEFEPGDEICVFVQFEWLYQDQRKLRHMDALIQQFRSRYIPLDTELGCAPAAAGQWAEKQKRILVKLRQLRDGSEEEFRLTLDDIIAHCVSKSSRIAKLGHQHAFRPKRTARQHAGGRARFNAYEDGWCWQKNCSMDDCGCGRDHGVALRVADVVSEGEGEDDNTDHSETYCNTCTDEIDWIQENVDRQQFAALDGEEGSTDLEAKEVKRAEASTPARAKDSEKTGRDSLGNAGKENRVRGGKGGQLATRPICDGNHHTRFHTASDFVGGAALAAGNGKMITRECEYCAIRHQGILVTIHGKEVLICPGSLLATRKRLIPGPLPVGVNCKRRTPPSAPSGLVAKITAHARLGKEALQKFIDETRNAEVKETLKETNMYELVLSFAELAPKQYCASVDYDDIDEIHADYFYLLEGMAMGHFEGAHQALEADDVAELNRITEAFRVGSTDWSDFEYWSATEWNDYWRVDDADLTKGKGDGTEENHSAMTPEDEPLPKYKAIASGEAGSGAGNGGPGAGVITSGMSTAPDSQFSGFQHRRYAGLQESPPTNDDREMYNPCAKTMGAYDVDVNLLNSLRNRWCTPSDEVEPQLVNTMEEVPRGTGVLDARLCVYRCPTSATYDSDIVPEDDHQGPSAAHHDEKSRGADAKMGLGESMSAHAEPSSSVSQHPFYESASRRSGEDVTPSKSRSWEARGYFGSDRTDADYAETVPKLARLSAAWENYIWRVQGDVSSTYPPPCLGMCEDQQVVIDQFRARMAAGEFGGLPPPRPQHIGRPFVDAALDEWFCDPDWPTGSLEEFMKENEGGDTHDGKLHGATAVTELVNSMTEAEQEQPSAGEYYMMKAELINSMTETGQEESCAGEYYVLETDGEKGPLRRMPTEEELRSIKRSTGLGALQVMGLLREGRSISEIRDKGHTLTPRTRAGLLRGVSYYKDEGTLVEGEPDRVGRSEMQPDECERCGTQVLFSLWHRVCEVQKKLRKTKPLHGGRIDAKRLAEIDGLEDVVPMYSSSGLVLNEGGFDFLVHTDYSGAGGLCGSYSVSFEGVEEKTERRALVDWTLCNTHAERDECCAFCYKNQMYRRLDRRTWVRKITSCHKGELRHKHLRDRGISGRGIWSSVRDAHQSTVRPHENDKETPMKFGEGLEFSFHDRAEWRSALRAVEEGICGSATCFRFGAYDYHMSGEVSPEWKRRIVVQGARRGDETSSDDGSNGSELSGVGEFLTEAERCGVLDRREWRNRRDACEWNEGPQEFVFENVIYVHHEGKWHSRCWIASDSQVIGLGDLRDLVRSGRDPEVSGHVPLEGSGPVTTVASRVIRGYEVDRGDDTDSGGVNENFDLFAKSDMNSGSGQTWDRGRGKNIEHPNDHGTEHLETQNAAPAGATGKKPAATPAAQTASSEDCENPSIIVVGRGIERTAEEYHSESGFFIGLLFECLLMLVVLGAVWHYFGEYGLLVCFYNFVSSGYWRERRTQKWQQRFHKNGIIGEALLDVHAWCWSCLAWSYNVRAFLLYWGFGVSACLVECLCHCLARRRLSSRSWCSVIEINDKKLPPGKRMKRNVPGYPNGKNYFLYHDINSFADPDMLEGKGYDVTAKRLPRVKKGEGKRAPVRESGSSMSFARELRERVLGPTQRFLVHDLGILSGENGAAAYESARERVDDYLRVVESGINALEVKRRRAVAAEFSAIFTVGMSDQLDNEKGWVKRVAEAVGKSRAWGVMSGEEGFAKRTILSNMYFVGVKQESDDPVTGQHHRHYFKRVSDSVLHLLGVQGDYLLGSIGLSLEQGLRVLRNPEFGFVKYDNGFERECKYNGVWDETGQRALLTLRSGDACELLIEGGVPRAGLRALLGGEDPLRDSVAGGLINTRINSESVSAAAMELRRRAHYEKPEIVSASECTARLLEKAEEASDGSNGGTSQSGPEGPGFGGWLRGSIWRWTRRLRRALVVLLSDDEGGGSFFRKTVPGEYDEGQLRKLGKEALMQLGVSPKGEAVQVRQDCLSNRIYMGVPSPTGSSPVTQVLLDSGCTTGKIPSGQVLGNIYFLAAYQVPHKRTKEIQEKACFGTPDAQACTESLKYCTVQLMLGGHAQPQRGGKLELMPIGKDSGFRIPDCPVPGGSRELSAEEEFFECVNSGCQLTHLVGPDQIQSGVNVMVVRWLFEHDSLIIGHSTMARMGYAMGYSGSRADKLGSYLMQNLFSLRHRAAMPTYVMRAPNRHRNENYVLTFRQFVGQEGQGASRAKLAAIAEELSVDERAPVNSRHCQIVAGFEFDTSGGEPKADPQQLVVETKHNRALCSYRTYGEDTSLDDYPIGHLAVGRDEFQRQTETEELRRADFAIDPFLRHGATVDYDNAEDADDEAGDDDATDAEEEAAGRDHNVLRVAYFDGEERDNKLRRTGKVVVDTHKLFSEDEYEADMVEGGQEINFKKCSVKRCSQLNFTPKQVSAAKRWSRDRKSIDRMQTKARAKSRTAWGWKLIALCCSLVFATLISFVETVDAADVGANVFKVPDRAPSTHLNDAEKRAAVRNLLQEDFELYEGIAQGDMSKGFSRYELSEKLRRVTGWVYKCITRNPLRLFLGVKWAPQLFCAGSQLTFGGLRDPGLGAEEFTIGEGIFEDGALDREAERLGAKHGTVHLLGDSQDLFTRFENGSEQLDSDHVYSARQKTTLDREVSLLTDVVDDDWISSCRNLRGATGTRSSGRCPTFTPETDSSCPQREMTTEEKVLFVLGEGPPSFITRRLTKTHNLHEKGRQVFQWVRTNAAKSCSRVYVGLWSCAEEMGFEGCSDFFLASNPFLDRPRDDPSGERAAAEKRLKERIKGILQSTPGEEHLIPYVDDVNFTFQGLWCLLTRCTWVAVRSTQSGVVMSLKKFKIGRVVSALGWTLDFPRRCRVPDLGKASAIRAYSWDMVCKNPRALKRFLCKMNYLREAFKEYDEEYLKGFLLDKKKFKLLRDDVKARECFCRIRRSVSDAVEICTIDLDGARNWRTRDPKENPTLRRLLDSSRIRANVYGLQYQRGMQRMFLAATRKFSKEHQGRIGASSIMMEITGLLFFARVIVPRLPRVGVVVYHDSTVLTTTQLWSLCASVTTIRSLVAMTSEILAIFAEREIYMVAVNGAGHTLADTGSKMDSGEKPDAGATFDQLKKNLNDLFGVGKIRDEDIAKEAAQLEKESRKKKGETEKPAAGADGSDDDETIGTTGEKGDDLALRPVYPTATKLQAMLGITYEVVSRRDIAVTPQFRLTELIGGKRYDLKGQVHIEVVGQRNKYGSMGVDIEELRGGVCDSPILQGMNIEEAKAEIKHRLEKGKNKVSEDEFFDLAADKLEKELEEWPLAGRMLLLRLLLIMRHGFWTEGRDFPTCLLGQACHPIRQDAKFSGFRKIVLEPVLDFILRLHLVEHLMEGLCSVYDIGMGIPTQLSALFLAVRKLSGLGRLIVDATALNLLFEDAAFPLAEISEIWRKLTTTIKAVTRAEYLQLIQIEESLEADRERERQEQKFGFRAAPFGSDFPLLMENKEIGNLPALTDEGPITIRMYRYTDLPGSGKDGDSIKLTISPYKALPQPLKKGKAPQKVTPSHGERWVSLHYTGEWKAFPRLQALFKRADPCHNVHPSRPCEYICYEVLPETEEELMTLVNRDGGITTVMTSHRSGNIRLGQPRPSFVCPRCVCTERVPGEYAVYSCGVLESAADAERNVAQPGSGSSSSSNSKNKSKPIKKEGVVVPATGKKNGGGSGSNAAGKNTVGEKDKPKVVGKNNKAVKKKKEEPKVGRGRLLPDDDADMVVDVPDNALDPPPHGVEMDPFGDDDIGLGLGDPLLDADSANLGDSLPPDWDHLADPGFIDPADPGSVLFGEDLDGFENVEETSGEAGSLLLGNKAYDGKLVKLGLRRIATRCTVGVVDEGVDELTFEEGAVEFTTLMRILRHRYKRDAVFDPKWIVVRDCRGKDWEDHLHLIAYPDGTSRVLQFRDDGVIVRFGSLLSFVTLGTNIFVDGPYLCAFFQNERYHTVDPSMCPQIRSAIEEGQRKELPEVFASIEGDSRGLSEATIRGHVRDALQENGKKHGERQVREAHANSKRFRLQFGFLLVYRQLDQGLYIWLPTVVLGKVKYHNHDYESTSPRRAVLDHEHTARYCIQHSGLYEAVIASGFFCDTLWKECAAMVGRCLICCSAKLKLELRGPPRGERYSVVDGEGGDPGTVLVIDYVTGLPMSNTGKAVIFTANDAVSGLLWTFAGDHATAALAVDCVLRIFIEYDEYYVMIRCDNGSHFLALFKRLLEERLQKEYLSPVIPKVAHGPNYGPWGQHETEGPHKVANRSYRVALFGEVGFKRVVDRNGESVDFESDHLDEDVKVTDTPYEGSWTDHVSRIRRDIVTRPFPELEGATLLHLHRGRGMALNGVRAAFSSGHLHDALARGAALKATRENAGIQRQNKREARNIKDRRTYFQQSRAQLDWARRGAIVMRILPSKTKLQTFYIKQLFVIAVVFTNSVSPQRLDGHKYSGGNPIVVSHLREVQLTKTAVRGYFVDAGMSEREIELRFKDLHDLEVEFLDDISTVAELGDYVAAHGENQWRLIDVGTYNVDGFRAACCRGWKLYLMAQLLRLCSSTHLQEMKCQQRDVKKVARSLQLIAGKDEKLNKISVQSCVTRPGNYGVASISTNKIIDLQPGYKHESTDDYDPSLEGRLTVVEETPEVLSVGIYQVNSGTDLRRFNTRETWMKAVMAFLKDAQKTYRIIIFTGDFNALASSGAAGKETMYRDNENQRTPSLSAEEQIFFASMRTELGFKVLPVTHSSDGCSRSFRISGTTEESWFSLTYSLLWCDAGVEIQSAEVNRETPYDKFSRAQQEKDAAWKQAKINQIAELNIGASKEELRAILREEERRTPALGPRLATFSDSIKMGTESSTAPSVYLMHVPHDHCALRTRFQYRITAEQGNKQGHDNKNYDYSGA
eukprot:g9646.t1